MTPLYAVAGVGAVVAAFVSIGLLIGLILLVALGALIAAACVAVGTIVGEAYESIGHGRRRSPDVPYGSAN